MGPADEEGKPRTKTVKVPSRVLSEDVGIKRILSSPLSKED